MIGVEKGDISFVLSKADPDDQEKMWYWLLGNDTLSLRVHRNLWRTGI